MIIYMPGVSRTPTAEVRGLQSLFVLFVYISMKQHSLYTSRSVSGMKHLLAGLECILQTHMSSSSMVALMSAFSSATASSSRHTTRHGLDNHHVDSMLQAERVLEYVFDCRHTSTDVAK